REVFAEGPEDRPVGLLVEVGLPAVAGGLVEPGGDRMPVLVRLRDDHRPAGADSDRTPVSAVGVPLTGQVSGAVRNRASSAHAGHLLRGSGWTEWARHAAGEWLLRALDAPAGEVASVERGRGGGEECASTLQSDDEPGVWLVSSELLGVLLAEGREGGPTFTAGLAPMMLATERSEEHTSELQSRENLVCRLLL